MTDIAPVIDQAVEAGRFLEWVDFLDYRQGTPVPDAPPGTDIIFEIDVAGAAAVLALDPHALLVFVDTPDRDEQRRRLEGRGDTPERVEEREAATRLPMHHIVNDDLDDAVAELAALIDTHRAALRPR